MSIQSYRDLRVWQAAMDLVVEIYRLSAEFPQEERYVLSQHLRRSAISVPSNIAEGYARETTREYLRHIDFAQASLAEMETQVQIAERLQYVSAESCQAVLEAAGGLGRQLFALRNALRKRTPTPDS